MLFRKVFKIYTAIIPCPACQIIIGKTSSFSTRRGDSSILMNLKIGGDNNSSRSYGNFIR